MGYFDATVAAVLAGNTVGAVDLIKFDWLPTPGFYWIGAGKITTPDGTTWSGLEQILAVDGLQYALGTAAPQATFTVSATDPHILTLAQQQSALVKRRGVTVFRQFFQGTTTAFLDAPYALWSGLMDVMSYRAMKSGVYQVSVTAETVWTGRNRPPFGYYDPQDQTARGFGTDTGLNQIPALAGATLLWKTT